MQARQSSRLQRPRPDFLCWTAETLEEVRQLEAALKSGVMPSQLQEHAQTVDISSQVHSLLSILPSQDTADPEAAPKDVHSNEDEEMQDAD